MGCRLGRRRRSKPATIWRTRGWRYTTTSHSSPSDRYHAPLSALLSRHPRLDESLARAGGLGSCGGRGLHSALPRRLLRQGALVAPSLCQRLVDLTLVSLARRCTGAAWRASSSSSKEKTQQIVKKTHPIMSQAFPVGGQPPVRPKVIPPKYEMLPPWQPSRRGARCVGHGSTFFGDSLNFSG